ncbi:MAG: hypothetical protein MK100_00435 [Phycisphaerales bacterium]|nr:hypothetical protein [Phycisphaerales bacterium]
MKNRCGAILLEALVGLAIVVGVSAFTLQALDDASEGLERADRRRRCMDTASSIVAMLDTGMIGIGALRSGSLPEVDDTALDDGSSRPLTLTVETERTIWPEIIRLTVMVSEQVEEGDVGVDATLHHLVRLRSYRSEEMNQDELLEGLP